MRNKNVVYILKNPSFPQLVKIGYADDVEVRLRVLNSNPGLPYAFRIYATYEVDHRLQDREIHIIFDQLNSSLRCREMINGRERVREFYQMSAEKAYAIFEAMAKFSGTLDRLHRFELTPEAQAEEEDAEEVLALPLHRHHFKDITFHSSLTGKSYDSKTKEDGSLGIYEHDTHSEVISFSRPSKKQIIRAAVNDLGGNGDNSKTLYQLMHILEKLVMQSENI